MFIPFLKAKSQMVQTKNWSGKKLHNIAGIAAIASQVCILKNCKNDRPKKNCHFIEG